MRSNVRVHLTTSFRSIFFQFDSHETMLLHKTFSIRIEERTKKIGLSGTKLVMTLDPQMTEIARTIEKGLMG